MCVAAVECETDEFRRGFCSLCLVCVCVCVSVPALAASASVYIRLLYTRLLTAATRHRMRMRSIYERNHTVGCYKAK